MEDGFAKSCPCCKRPYSIRLKKPRVRKGLPLLLQCGHTLCEDCILNTIIYLEPIECMVCDYHANIKTTETEAFLRSKINMYKMFPVNMAIVAELFMKKLKEELETTPDVTEEDCFINIKALIADQKGHCARCRRSSMRMCKQCDNILCVACFKKTHRNYLVFKKHQLKNIVPSESSNALPFTLTCKLHQNPLQYYCNDCKKPTCNHCIMLDGENACKTHEIVSIKDINIIFLEKLITLAPQIDEMFRRLTDTAVNVGNLLCHYLNGTGPVEKLTEIVDNAEQHFSKLVSIIHQQKEQFTNTILYIKISAEKTLQRTKTELGNSIKKTSTVLKIIRAVENQDPKEVEQYDLSAVLKAAEQIIETPWYLIKMETTKESLKVTVNEEILTMIRGYVQLEGRLKSIYKLYPTSLLNEQVEIPPAPVSPVYPQIKWNAYELRLQPELGSPALSSRSESSDTSEGSGSNATINTKKTQKHGNIIPADNWEPITKCQPPNEFVYPEQPHIRPASPALKHGPPKVLCEGTKELVYVTHVEDPHNFFIQRACCKRDIGDMLQKFYLAKGFPKPSLNQIIPGAILLAMGWSKNLWTRCRVLSVDMSNENQPKIKVFFIDFGDTEIVSDANLRVMPPSEADGPDPYAINCSVFNCEPRTGSWKPEDGVLTRNILSTNQVIIHVRRIISMPDGLVKLECDVSTMEHGFSLVDALVFQERAKMTDPKIPYPEDMGRKDKHYVISRKNDFKQDQQERVSLIHVVSPAKFFVRKLTDDIDYQIISEDLTSEYSGTPGTVYLPEIGVVYAVSLENCPWRLETKWARGVVSKLLGRGNVCVIMPDSGRIEILHWSFLRYLHPKFTTHSAFATECHLTGIAPFKNKWPAASVILLEQYLSSLLAVQLANNFHENSPSASCAVTLSYANRGYEEDVISLNEEMIKHKFAYPKSDTEFGNPVTVEEVWSDELPVKYWFNNKNNDDEKPLRLQVKVLQCQSPSLIYVSLVHQQKQYSDLMDDMQKYYSNNDKTIPEDDWKVGDRCSALCIQTQTWRRAGIIELENDSATVFYIDFACINTIPKTRLKELSAEYSMIGDGAIKCHLFGIMPGAGKEWPKTTTEYLKEILEAFKTFYITKMSNIKDNSLSILLWVNQNTQGGSLDWRCLNQIILHQGLCVLDESQAVEDDTGDILSSLNTTGSVNEWLQLELIIIPQNTVESDDDITIYSPVSFLEDDDDDQRIGEAAGFSKDWVTA